MRRVFGVDRKHRRRPGCLLEWSGSAYRGLYFRQPARGLPGVPAGRLIEIVKGVFGLSTSPRLWFEKLVGEILTVKVPTPQGNLHFEQDKIDPCVLGGEETVGILETHVDDLLLLAQPSLREVVQASLSKVFPISEWEEDNFKYVGSNYVKTEAGYTISQTDYVEERLKYIDVPKGANKDGFHDNRTAVGCLSWLEKETRPDLACSASLAQSQQGSPTLQSIKDTNKAIQQAKEFRDHGVQIAPVPLSRMSLGGAMPNQVMRLWPTSSVTTWGRRSASWSWRYLAKGLGKGPAKPASWRGSPTLAKECADLLSLERPWRAVKGWSARFT